MLESCSPAEEMNINSDFCIARCDCGMIWEIRHHGASTYLMIQVFVSSLRPSRSFTSVASDCDVHFILQERSKITLDRHLN